MAGTGLKRAGTERAGTSCACSLRATPQTPGVKGQALWCREGSKGDGSMLVGLRRCAVSQTNVMPAHCSIYLLLTQVVRGKRA